MNSIGTAPVARNSTPYRDVLNTPGTARAHEYQRLVSYGVAIAVSLAVGFPGWRMPVVLGIAILMFGGALWRLIADTKISPYGLAQLDLLLAGVAIASATASLAITTAAVAFIVVAVTASFRAPRRTAVAASIACGAPPLIIASVLDSTTSGRETTYLATIVLVVIMLALSSFILAVIATRTRDLGLLLRHRESQLSAILDVTPVVLAAVDKDLTLTTLAGNSEVWHELSGKRLDGNSSLAKLVGTAQGTARSTADIAIDDRTFNVTCDPGTEGESLLTVYDVTVRTIARQRLEEIVRSKDQFIAAVSHELRTPLASVVGFSELIRERMNPIDPLEPMMMEVADQSAEMAAIIDDLLIAARASFESVPTQPRDINLAAEANAVIETMGSRLETPPQRRLADVVAYADPIRVRQIIRNLLTNADRYGGEEVWVGTVVADSAAVLTVKDSGAPLPPERREAIFEPYESSGPVRGQPAAIGLGLAVSRTLAELMGGSISYGHDGSWSVFELRLPRNSVQIERVLADTRNRSGGFMERPKRMKEEW